MISFASIEKYAADCAVTDGQGSAQTPVKAFITPLRYKNKMYLYGVNTEIGYNPEGYYLYLGPPQPVPEQRNSIIIRGDERFRVDRAEEVRFGNDVFYVWAILRKESADPQAE